MHTSSKLNATPHERLAELEERFPFLQFVARPLFLLLLAVAIVAASLGYVAWSASDAAHDVWSGYTDSLHESAAPVRP